MKKYFYVILSKDHLILRTFLPSKIFRVKSRKNQFDQKIKNELFREVRTL